MMRPSHPLLNAVPCIMFYLTIATQIHVGMLWNCISGSLNSPPLSLPPYCPGQGHRLGLHLLPSNRICALWEVAAQVVELQRSNVCRGSVRACPMSTRTKAIRKTLIFYGGRFAPPPSKTATGLGVQHLVTMNHDCSRLATRKRSGRPTRTPPTWRLQVIVDVREGRVDRIVRLVRVVV